MKWFGNDNIALIRNDAVTYTGCNYLIATDINEFDIPKHQALWWNT